MAQAHFDVTPDEADDLVDSLLKQITYYKIVAAWIHDSGARLTAFKLKNTNCYGLAWRASSSCVDPCVVTISGFEDADADMAWARLMRDAELAFENGPPRAVLDKREERRADKISAGQAGGQASGKVRSQKARENEEAFTAAREQMQKVFGISTVPKFDSRKWQFQIDTAFKEGVASLSFKAIPGCYIGAVKESGWFFVERGFYPGGNSDNARIEEQIGGGGTWEEALPILNALAASDPLTWQKKQTAQFKPAKSA